MKFVMSNEALEITTSSDEDNLRIHDGAGCNEERTG